MPRFVTVTRQITLEQKRFLEKRSKEKSKPEQVSIREAIDLLIEKEKKSKKAKKKVKK